MPETREIPNGVLSPTEREIFSILAEREGEICSVANLTKNLTGGSKHIEILRVNIGRLRRKLEQHNCGTVEVVRGQGYRYINHTPLNTKRLEGYLNLISNRGGGIQSLFNWMLESYQDLMERLSQGEGQLPDFSEVNLWSAFLKGADKSVDAVSCVNPNQWWVGQAGEYYTQVNEELVQQGVDIRRVFLLLDEEELQSYESLFERQVRAGVKVRYALLSETKKADKPVRLAFDKAWDIVVVDRIQLIQLQPTPLTRKLKPGSSISNREDLVAEKVQAFDQLWSWDDLKAL